jgi:hypothetical protein
MPCRSDYMEPTNKELLLRETAQLLIYVRMNTSRGIRISNTLKAASQDSYCKEDYVAELCSAIRALAPEEMDRIVYDGRNSEARKLADWWDKHQEADRKRQEEEEREQKRTDLRNAGLAKLTPEEIEALGILPSILRG